MDDSLSHKISIETTCKSKARLFWGKKRTKKFLLGEHYETTLKMRNVGEKDFPGGRALIRIIYAAPQSHSENIPLPEIKIDQEAPPMKFSKAALGKGYASFFCDIIAIDNEQVKIIRNEQELPRGASFYDIFIETRAEIYTYFILFIAFLSFILSLISILK